MFTDEESLLRDKIIPHDYLSWTSQENDYSFITDFPPLPMDLIPSMVMEHSCQTDRGLSDAPIINSNTFKVIMKNEFTPITSELNKGIQFPEEISNIVIEISKNVIKNEILNESNQLKGRKRRNFRANFTESEKKCHDKFGADNVFIKVKAHYQKFITDFFNIILEAFGFKDKFIKINYIYITKFNKTNFNSLKNISIINILEQNISPRFRTKNKKSNKNIIKKIITNPFVNKLLAESYINLFKNVYYKSERNINLKKYGLDIDIILPKDKVKMFSDLIEKFNKVEDHKYIERLKNYVKKKFLD